MKKLSRAEFNRLEKMSVFEKRLKGEGYSRVAGIDEAGRGPLAGPVVAAACILPEGALFDKLNDSKQLEPEERNKLYDEITSYPGLIYGIGIGDVKLIDQINILQATFAAMRRAIEALAFKPDYLLIDGNQIPTREFPAEAVIEGDSRSISIAAASIIAKVTRDRMMEQLDMQWPDYGFRQHKGYATPRHLEAIQKWGPCPIHRKSFDPVRCLLATEVQLDLLS